MGRNHIVATLSAAARPAASDAQASPVTSRARSPVVTTTSPGAATTSRLWAETTPPGSASWNGTLASPSVGENVWKSSDTPCGKKR